MKKAQIIGQVFIYIMTAIVIGMIVLIGYWAYDNITKRACLVEQINFNSKLQYLMEQYTTYGSMHKDVLTAPCNYEYLCFVDAAMVGKSAELAGCSFNGDDNELIIQSIKGNERKNIFAADSRYTFPVGFSPRIAVADPKCLCIQEKGRNFYITFNGNGATTTVSETR